MTDSLLRIWAALTRRPMPERHGSRSRSRSRDSALGPCLLILGAAKAGTTNLFKLLTSVPGFSGSCRKELRYFSMEYYYQQGPDWYHKQFGDHAAGIKFEATPHYLYFPCVPERVYNYQREMRRALKFIVMLREPVARCYSAWNMERSYHLNRSTEIIEQHYRYYNPDIRESLTALLLGEAFPSFRQSVRDDMQRLHNSDTLLEPSYVRKGLYSEQITRWLRWFDRSSFLFLEFRELSQPAQILQKVGHFLGVPIPTTTHQSVSLKHNAGEYPSTSEETRRTMDVLHDFYRPYNEHLFRIIGRRFDWNERLAGTATAQTAPPVGLE